jgi:alpha-beta hydrolase superfamily lysophospholipase
LRADPTEVHFSSAGERLSALLYLPEGTGPHPCVVLGGGWCYVKELVQPSYAAVFARNGMAALIFDYRYMGSSSGEPRQHIDPWQQIEDYRNAISFIGARDDVDHARIGAWGISYSGGHVMILGALDPRVRAICGIVPTVDGYQNMRLAHGTLGFRRLEAALLEARHKLYATGAHTYLPHQPSDESELATWPFPKSRATFARLKETQAPAYEGRSTAASTEMLLSYSVMPYVERLLTTPTLLVVAEGDDHTHWDLAAKAYDAIPGDRKRLHVVPKSTHLTLYEDEPTVSEVAGVAADWFSERL